MPSDGTKLLTLPVPADRAEFSQLVFRIVRWIPVGRVMTYGQIASLIPTPQFIDPIAYKRIRARWVGYALATGPGDVPWQRVVNHRGQASRRSSGGHKLQLELLRAEGTPLINDRRVDLEQARWQPNPTKAEPAKGYRR